MYSPPQSPPTSPPRTYTASLGDRDYDEERKDDSLRSDPSSVISTASTMATPAKLEAGDRVLGTYGDETRRAVVRDVDATGEKIVVEFSPTPRSASQVSSMFARDVSFVSRPAKPHALAHLLPPKLGDALGRTVELSEAFRDAEAIGIYIVDQARPSAAATERLANLRRWVGGRKFGVALYELSSQMPGDVDMTLKAKGGHRVLLGDDPNILVVDAPETVVTNWNLFEVCSVRQLPALVVVSPSAEVFTRDGVESRLSLLGWRRVEEARSSVLSLYPAEHSAADILLADHTLAAVASASFVRESSMFDPALGAFFSRPQTGKTFQALLTIALDRRRVEQMRREVLAVAPSGRVRAEHVQSSGVYRSRTTLV